MNPKDAGQLQVDESPSSDSLTGFSEPGLVQLLRDPYTGQSIHFTLVEGRPKLWLSGPNQRDDGGLSEAMGADDIVWSYPAP